MNILINEFFFDNLKIKFLFIVFCFILEFKLCIYIFLINILLYIVLNINNIIYIFFFQNFNMI